MTFVIFGYFIFIVIFKETYGQTVCFSNGCRALSGILLCSSFHTDFCPTDILDNLLTTEEELLDFCEMYEIDPGGRKLELIFHHSINQ